MILSSHNHSFKRAANTIKNYSPRIASSYIHSTVIETPQQVPSLSKLSTFRKFLFDLTKLINFTNKAHTRETYFTMNKYIDFIDSCMHSDMTNKLSSPTFNKTKIDYILSEARIKKDVIAEELGMNLSSQDQILSDTHIKENVITEESDMNLSSQDQIINFLNEKIIIKANQELMSCPLLEIEDIYEKNKVYVMGKEYNLFPDFSLINEIFREQKCI